MNQHISSGIVKTGALPANGPRITLVIAVVLVGLSAGFFVAYVSSVTRGLAEVADVTYVEAFQEINESVRNPLFGIVFFGSIPALLIAIVANWSRATTPKRVLLLTALPLYLAALFITAIGNVPLNDDLDEVVVTGTDVASQARAAFEDDWNRFNLARTVAVVASFVSVATASVLTDDR